MINALKELISIESVAETGCPDYPYGTEPAKALDYALELCQSFGFRTKNAGYRYGYAEIGEGEELIGILCHLDVVPAGSGWTYPPFEGTEADGKIFGRGAIDDKGPAVASVFAMKDLLDRGTEMNKRIRIIFGQTEENGDWYDMDAYKECEQVPDFGFTPDGAFPAIYGEKGIMIVKVKMPLASSGFIHADGGSSPNMVADFCRVQTATGSFETKGVSAHGSMPWEGENAITKMMEQLTDSESCEDLPFARMYMELIGRDFHGERLGCCFEDEASGMLSLNAGRLCEEGDDVCLWLDIRYPVTFDKEDVMQALEQTFGPYGAKVKLQHHMEKVYMEEDGPVMKALLSAYRNVTGDMSRPEVTGGGTYARAMENIVAFGPQLPGYPSVEHKCDEYIEIDHLQQLRAVYCKALENLLKM